MERFIRTYVSHHTYRTYSMHTYLAIAICHTMSYLKCKCYTRSANKILCMIQGCNAYSLQCMMWYERYDAVVQARPHSEHCEGG